MLDLKVRQSQQEFVTAYLKVRAVCYLRVRENYANVVKYRANVREMLNHGVDGLTVTTGTLREWVTR